MGLERLVLLLEKQQPMQSTVDAYFILVGEATIATGLIWAERLRHALPSLSLEVDLTKGSLKSQFKRADKSGARWALILGEDELVKKQIALKDLRAHGNEQIHLSLSALIEKLT